MEYRVWECACFEFYQIHDLEWYWWFSCERCVFSSSIKDELSIKKKTIFLDSYSSDLMYRFKVVSVFICLSMHSQAIRNSIPPSQFVKCTFGFFYLLNSEISMHGVPKSWNWWTSMSILKWGFSFCVWHMYIRLCLKMLPMEKKYVNISLFPKKKFPLVFFSLLPPYKLIVWQIENESWQTAFTFNTFIEMACICWNNDQR